MRTGLRAARLAAAVGTFIVATGPGSTPVPAADSLPDRLAAYAVQFGREFQGVVATEQYVQVIQPWSGFAPKTPTLAGRTIQVRRELRSELLLVYDAEGPWHLHRDVRAVDGTPVGDRESRLQALFVEPGLDARDRLRRITRDSARYNLGDVTRTLNIPTFPLIVVHPAHRSRFRLRLHGTRQQDGTTIREVTFDERRRPTLVRSTEGRDVPLHGRLLVDEATGALIHARIDPTPLEVTSRIEVWFEKVDGLPLRVPVRMWEWYHPQDDSLNDAGEPYIEALATYSDFRRYGVEVEETVGAPR